MSVWEVMLKFGRDQKFRISDGKTELTHQPITADEYEMYSDEFPREDFEPILGKTATSVDLERMIIYCRG